MRKKILGALIASAFAVGGTAHAGLMLDLNGAAFGGVITAEALDWSPTSFLAKGGNTAIRNFAGAAQFGLTCAAAGVDCTFEVLTHATLNGYRGTTGGFIGLPAAGGEITMVARYTEVVTSFTPGASPFAQFRSTGDGVLEFYYSPAADSADLTGSGFNNGRLIGRLDGVKKNVLGSFTVDGEAVPFVQNLDQTPDSINDYTGQFTIIGAGSQGSILAGTTGVLLDPTFFLTTMTGFAINFQNISIGLPYQSVNPSDCFNDIGALGSRVIGTSYLSTCDVNHVNGTYAAQGVGPGYLPVVGGTNGLGLDAPDFIAQTDFNSSVQGIPEPGTLALMGLALGAMGFVAARRRRS